MPCFCIAHQKVFLGTLSKAFSRSIKVKYKSLFFFCKVVFVYLTYYKYCICRSSTCLQTKLVIALHARGLQFRSSCGHWNFWSIKIWSTTTSQFQTWLRSAAPVPRPTGLGYCSTWKKLTVQTLLWSLILIHYNL